MEHKRDERDRETEYRKRGGLGGKRMTQAKIGKGLERKSTREKGDLDPSCRNRGGSG